jgi:cyanophycinase
MRSGKAGGCIALVGGAEDRKYDKKLLNAIVRAGRPATIAVVPTASSHPSETFRSYQRAFEEIGVDQVLNLEVRYRDQADRPEFLGMLETADLIFFTGGDQERLVEVLESSPFMKRVEKKVCQGAMLAGTSAGATAIGDPMIAGGNGSDGFKKGAVTIVAGFALLPNTVVDTHFMSRWRIARMAQVLSSGCCPLGIGLDEDTAILVRPDRTFEVHGSGSGTVMYAGRLSYSN